MQASKWAPPRSTMSWDTCNPGGFRECLSACRRHHEQLGKEIEEALARFEDDGKAPNAIARGMAWMKAHAQLAATPTDAAVASLITDGCNMGVKSLGRYLNEYVGCRRAFQGHRQAPHCPGRGALRPTRATGYKAFFALASPATMRYNRR